MKPFIGRLLPRTIRVAICIAALTGACARRATAQDSVGGSRARPVIAVSVGTIAGTIVDTAGTPLPHVEILFLDAPHSPVRTNAIGGYRIDSVAQGLHVLRFRRVGLVATVVSVPVRATEVTGVDVVMAAMPHTLAMITVQDTLGEVSRLPPDVIGRIRNGMGTYITAADIERRKPSRTSQMLQFVAGAEVTKDGAVNNTRGIISLKTDGCKYGMPVYIDGARIADPHIGADTLHGSPLVDYLPPSAVAAIELYRGGAELPGSLPQNTCGGLFIWTKH